MVLNQQNRNNFPFSAYEESTTSEATSEVDLVRGFLRFHLSHGKKATLLTHNHTEMGLKQGLETGCTPEFKESYSTYFISCEVKLLYKSA